MTIWTDQEDEKLRKLAGEGLSAAQIGRAMGRPRNSVIGRCIRRGIALHGLSKSGRPRAPILVAPRPKSLIRERVIKLKPSQDPEITKQIEPKAFDGEGQIKSIVDLTAGRCKWPYGHRNFTFCGEPTINDRYCAYHERIKWGRK